MNMKLIKLSMMLSLTASLMTLLFTLAVLTILYVLDIGIVMMVIGGILTYVSVSLIGAIQSASAIYAAIPERVRDDNGRYAERVPIYENGKVSAYVTRDGKAKVRAR